MEHPGARSTAVSSGLIPLRKSGDLEIWLIDPDRQQFNLQETPMFDGEKT
jgi:hypothetical protein